MKIAILTLPLHRNYGGILQAWAMQQVLRKMGHKPITLNRVWPYPLPPSLRLKLIRCISVAKCIVRRYILQNKDIVICSPFSEEYSIYKKELDKSAISKFISTNIALTKKFRDTEALNKYVRRKKIDCFIVGSDQVWRERYSPCITDNFLGFLPENSKAKKITYAASFGVNEGYISADKLNQCIALAKRFDTVTVREQSGVEIMKDTFHISAKLVLDPTLLLNREDYRSIINNKDLNDAGLTTYILDENEEKQQIVDEASSSLQLAKHPLRIYPKGDFEIPYKMKSISQWLAAFANASFVVTDSFHGCVFSIIFQKPFIAIANKDRGLERFLSLFNRLGLQDRLILTNDDFEKKKEQLLLPVDYEKVNSLLNAWKSDSINFLQDAMLGRTN